MHDSPTKTQLFHAEEVQMANRLFSLLRGVFVHTQYTLCTVERIFTGLMLKSSGQRDGVLKRAYGRVGDISPLMADRGLYVLRSNNSKSPSKN
jgi:hypothetical protein